MDLKINARDVEIDIPEYMMAEEIRLTMQNDDQLNILMTYMIHGYPLTMKWKKNHNSTITALMSSRAVAYH